jgi:hypothetical protein
MPLIWWLVVICGPISCASAGAITTWLFTRAHYERRLDAVYEDGWRAGRQWYPPEIDPGAVTLTVPASAVAQMALPAPERAAERQAALPAPRGLPGRHGAPEDGSGLFADLEAIATVRATFDRIRTDLGLQP